MLRKAHSLKMEEPVHTIIIDKISGFHKTFTQAKPTQIDYKLPCYTCSSLNSQGGSPSGYIFRNILKSYR